MTNSIKITLEGDSKPYTIHHVEFVRIVAVNVIEVKCFGNGSVLHRYVKSFEFTYEQPVF